MRTSGFVFIENIIVMLLLSVVVVGSSNLYSAVTGFVSREEQRLIAANLAYSQIEDLRRIAHANFADPALAATAVPVTHTDSITIPTNFSLTYTVTDNNRPENPPPAPADYKRVTVTCTTPTGFRVPLTGDVAS